MDETKDEILIDLKSLKILSQHCLDSLVLIIKAIWYIRSKMRS